MFNYVASRNAEAHAGLRVSTTLPQSAACARALWHEKWKRSSISRRVAARPLLIREGACCHFSPHVRSMHCASRGECLIRSHSISTYRRPFLAALPIFSRPAIFRTSAATSILRFVRFYSQPNTFTSNWPTDGDSVTRKTLLDLSSVRAGNVSSLSVRYHSLNASLCRISRFSIIDTRLVKLRVLLDTRVAPFKQTNRLKMLKIYRWRANNKWWLDVGYCVTDIQNNIFSPTQI